MNAAPNVDALEHQLLLVWNMREEGRMVRTSSLKHHLDKRPPGLYEDQQRTAMNLDGEWRQIPPVKLKRVRYGPYTSWNGTHNCTHHTGNHASYHKI